MATLSPPPHCIETFATDLVEAVARTAAYHADLVGHFLEYIGFLPPKAKRRKPIYLPPEFLLELAAILRLAMWEHGGPRDGLPSDLPSAAQALDNLTNRAAAKTPRFRTGPKAAPLLRRVLSVWLSHMAWHGHDLLGADLLLTGMDEDEFAVTMADFLWKHRHITLNEAPHEEA